MSQIILTSSTTSLNEFCSTPILLDRNVKHFMRILNFNYSNVFANTSVNQNKFRVTYYKSDGSNTKIDYYLPKHQLMELTTIYEKCIDKTKLDGVQYFDIKLDTSVGRCVIEPLPNIQELMTTNNITTISIDNSNQDGISILQSRFMFMDDIYPRFESGREMETFVGNKQPIVTSFNTLYLTSPMIVNNGRIKIDNDFKAIPIVISVDATGSPFEYVSRVAMQEIRSELIPTESITNFDFTLRNEFNDEPELVESNGIKADLEMFITLMIE